MSDEVRCTALIDLTNAPGVETAIVTHGRGYFPVVALAPDGSAVVVLRGGGGHMGTGGRLDLLSSADGLTWTASRTAVDTCSDDRNPAFGITTSGRYLLGFHLQASYTGHGVYAPSLGLSFDMQTWSDDEGLTWSPYANLRLGDVGSTSPYGRIVRLADGTYVQSVYGKASAAVPGALGPGSDAGCAYIVRSRDEGCTWGEPSLIATDHNETAVLPMPDGTLLAAARTSRSTGVSVFRSSDAGSTWEHVVRATGDAQIPADLIDLGGGAVLMVFGNRQEDKDIRGILSLDGGRTWNTQRHLRLTVPVTGDFGYPSVVRMGDRILLLHYWCGGDESWYDGSRAQCRATLIPVSQILSA